MLKIYSGKLTVAVADTGFEKKGARLCIFFLQIDGFLLGLHSFKQS